MAVSPGSLQDVSAPPTAWYSVGPELCRSQSDRSTCAAGLCHQWVYPYIHSWSLYAGFVVFMSTHELKPRTRDALLSKNMINITLSVDDCY